MTRVRTGAVSCYLCSTELREPLSREPAWRPSTASLRWDTAHCQVPRLPLPRRQRYIRAELAPGTYLPHGNYKAIIAQQASTHKVRPPGLLQIASDLLKLVSTCLSKAQWREVIFMEHDLRGFESPLLLDPTLEAPSGARILGLSPAAPRPGNHLC